MGDREQQLQLKTQMQLEEHLTLRSSLTDRLEAVTRHAQQSQADKEAMVVKYAQAEKNVSDM